MFSIDFFIAMWNRQCSQVYNPCGDNGRDKEGQEEEAGSREETLSVVLAERARVLATSDFLELRVTPGACGRGRAGDGNGGAGGSDGYGHGVDFSRGGRRWCCGVGDSRGKCDR